MIGNSNDDEANFPHKLLLTVRQVDKAFANNFQVIKLSQTQLFTIMQSDGFSCRLLRPLFKIK